MLNCVNINCIEKLEAKIIHAFSYDALDIKKISVPVIRQLIENGLLKDFTDIVNITEEQLLSLNRIRATTAKKVYNEFQRAKKQKLSRLVIALDIPNIGWSRANEITDGFTSIIELKQLQYDTLMRRPNIGKKGAHAFIQFMVDHSELIDKIDQRFTVMPSKWYDPVR